MALTQYSNQTFVLNVDGESLTSAQLSKANITAKTSQVIDELADTSDLDCVDWGGTIRLVQVD